MVLFHVSYIICRVWHILRQQRIGLPGTKYSLPLSIRFRGCVDPLIFAVLWSMESDDRFRCASVISRRLLLSASP